MDSLSYVDSAFQNTYNDDDDILHSDEEYIDQDYPDRIGTHHDQNLHFTSAYDFDDILDDPEMWEATYHDSYDDVPDLSSGSNSEGSSLQSSTSDRPSRMVENDFQAEMPYIPIKSDHMNVQDSSVMDADGDMSSMYDGTSSGGLELMIQYGDLGVRVLLTIHPPISMLLSLGDSAFSLALLSWWSFIFRSYSRCRLAMSDADYIYSFDCN